MLAIIALNSTTLSPNKSEQIEQFFKLKLMFDPVPTENRKYKTWDEYLEKAQQRALGLRPVQEDGESDDEIFSDEEGEDEMDRFEIDEKQKEFKLFLEQKA